MRNPGGRGETIKMFQNCSFVWFENIGFRGKVQIQDWNDLIKFKIFLRKIFSFKLTIGHVFLLEGSNTIPISWAETLSYSWGIVRQAFAYCTGEANNKLLWFSKCSWCSKPNDDCGNIIIKYRSSLFLFLSTKVIWLG